jgi:hypothetical protein
MFLIIAKVPVLVSDRNDKGLDDDVILVNSVELPTSGPDVRSVWAPPSLWGGGKGVRRANCRDSLGFSFFPPPGRDPFCGRSQIVPRLFQQDTRPRRGQARERVSAILLSFARQRPCVSSMRMGARFTPLSRATPAINKRTFSIGIQQIALCENIQHRDHQHYDKADGDDRDSVENSSGAWASGSTGGDHATTGTARSHPAHPALPYMVTVAS